MANETEWVRIERTFDAPIEAVWSMWTDPALFAKWYGPNGMTVPVAEMDVKPGGTRKICMKMERSDGAMMMWFTGEYRDVTPPTRLSYTESMCDENGKIISPESMGMPPGHPEVTEVIVELSSVDGKTDMKMTHVGVTANTQGAGGWAQAIDKMAALLAA